MALSPQSEPAADPVFGVDEGDDGQIWQGRERRLNIRAFGYWESLLDGRDFPAVGDLDPEAIAPFRDSSLLIDFTNGYDSPFLRYVGSHLRAEASITNGEIDPNDVPSGTLLSRLTNHYLEILANRAPIGFEAEYENLTGERVMYRGILLPLSDDGTTINFIYGVISWKTETLAKAQADAGQDSDEVLDLEDPVDLNDSDFLELTQALDDAETESLLAQAPAPDESAELEMQSLVSEIDAALSGMSEPAAAPSEPDEALDESVEALLEETQEPPAPPVEAEEEAAAVSNSAPASDSELLNMLAQCQSAAADLARFDSRSRAALYDTLSLCYDFYLVSQRQQSAYQELLEKTNIKVQERAPLTPVIKLVFGAGYDKTRVTEYAAALNYADRENVDQGSFQNFVEGFEGGIKAMVQAERAARQADQGNASIDRLEAAKALLRSLEARTVIDGANLGIESDTEDEFVLVVARKDASGGYALIDHLDAKPSVLESALKKVAAAHSKK